MRHILQRFGVRFTRWGGILVLIVAVLVGVAYWMGPLRPWPAELQLLALADSPTTSVIATPRQDSVTGELRFGVPLGVRNVGARAALPDRVLLSVPAYYRLSTSAGPLPSDATPGVPLRRFAVDVKSAPIPADSVVRVLSGADTLWIEPNLQRYYCTEEAGNILEFTPAPPRDPAILSDLRIFYSLSTPQGGERHAGLLAVRIDPEALHVEPVPMPPTYSATYRDPEVDAPELGPVHYVGARAASCGDPEQPLELYSVTWESRGTGARLYVVHMAGTARKRLYDVDHDDVIELETWDVDGDGRFEARRQARFRVPDFLKPPPSRVAASALNVAPPDSAWLVVFNDPARGPARFSMPIPRPEPVSLDSPGSATDSAGAAIDTMNAAADSAPRPDSAGAGGALAPDNAARAPDDVLSVARPTRAFIALFDDTAAGPFRFSRPSAIDSAVVRAATDSADEARRLQSERRTQPLGVPVPYPRPDTLRR